MKPTQGPWYAAETGNKHDQGLVISEATGENVAVTYNGMADTHLCAAAFEMLAFLEDILPDLFPDQQRRAYELIYKAKGED